MAMSKYYPMDIAGNLVNASSLDFQSPWRVAVSEIGAAYEGYLKTRLHSAYVRGSVAKGTAIPQLSDIDTFAMVRGPLIEGDKEWKQKISRLMEERHRYAQSVEIVLVPLDSTPENIRFIIKTQSICICGTDLSPEISNYKPGRGIGFLARNLSKMLSSTRKELELHNDSDEVMEICIWIMKAIVRSGFEVVMERENAYTRDLIPCFEGFSKYYQERSESMRRALDLAVNPSSSPGEVLAVTSDLGEWLTKEIEDRIGL
jgi:uncharacterized protein